ncbi:MAG: hypothetical protein JNJ61_26865 [Anaerolineae bacterium]|nr:hypothetical protein [Anaerolineae bacterium]
MKRIAVFVFVGLLLVGALSVGAQGLSDGEKEAVADVGAAFEAFLELETYTSVIEQTITQNITMEMGQQTVKLSNIISQSGTSVIQNLEDGFNMEGKLEQLVSQDMGAGAQDMGWTLDLVIVDGVLYGRVDNATGLFATIAPEGWVNVNEDGAASPIFASINAQMLQQTYGLSYPMNEETVTSITKLDTEELDGQVMRVFDVDYDINVLLESGLFDATLGSMNAQPGMTQQDMRDLVTQMMEGADFQLKVWIGQDDGLVHRFESTLLVDSTVTIQGMTLPLVMDVVSSVSFSGFNEPVEITAPEM